MARKWRDGTVKFFWRTTFNRKLFREDIGIYSVTANRAWKVPAEDGRYSVSAAAAKATSLALEHEVARVDGGLFGKREKEHAARVELERYEKAQVQALEEAAKVMQQQSLSALLTLYSESLLARGAPSAREVSNALKLHVTESSRPEVKAVAQMSAKAVSRQDVVAVLAPIYAAGKGRQANKIRAYLQAAFEMAIDAAGNALTASAVRDFNLEWNPVSKTAKNQQFNCAAKWELNIDEMRDYWQIIREVPGARGASLRLHLLLGAPRVQQLVRVTTNSLASDALKLIDIKGRSSTPRPYELPLHDVVRQDIQVLRGNKPYLFSSDGGATPMANTTLSGWAKELVGDRIANFQMKRVRSGVETMLATLGFHNDVRGKLQSHGNGGVQDSHYNGHDYYFEKLDALEALYGGLTAAVAPVRRRALYKPRSGGES